jgi:hypothetical protein
MNGMRTFAAVCRTLQIVLHHLQNPPTFHLRLVPAFAAICRSLLLPKGKKRATHALPGSTGWSFET